MELFCNDPGCDCRRAYFLVTEVDDDEPKATLTWGWEEAQFYRNWASFALSADDIEELTGPALARLAHQSPIAPDLLNLLKLLLQDEEYRQRIRRHYHLFRSRVDAMQTGGAKLGLRTQWRSSSKKNRKREPK